MFVGVFTVLNMWQGLLTQGVQWRSGPPVCAVGNGQEGLGRNSKQTCRRASDVWIYECHHIMDVDTCS